MASTKLTRTPSSAGNRDKWTLSFWLKRASLGVSNETVTNVDAGSGHGIQFQSGDTLRWFEGGATTSILATTRVFRDTSAWYHFVFAWDSGNATSSERAKIYVNGEQITDFGTETYPSQNADSTMNSTTALNIGDASSGYEGFTGCLAHVHFTDGYLYDADDFGETESSSGIWKPKLSPSVTYGTNGFFLKFQDSSALGDDSSGNTNDFTLSGSGTQTLDTPSNVQATWNQNLAMNTTMVFTHGNTTGKTGSTYASGRSNSFFSTLGATSGKWYAEFKLSATTSDAATYIGVSYGIEINQKGSAANAYGFQYIDSGWGWIGTDGDIRNNNAIVTGGENVGNFTTNDIVMIALDMDNHYVYWGKNGTWINSGDPTSGSSGTGGFSITNNGLPYFFAATDASLSNQMTWQANFGNGYFGTTAVASANSDEAGWGKFEYTVPSGYYTLNTRNLSEYG